MYELSAPILHTCQWHLLSERKTSDRMNELSELYGNNYLIVCMVQVRQEAEHTEDNNGKEPPQSA